MPASNLLSRQSQMMFVIGIGLWVFSGVEGFFIPHLASPPLGRSVHTLSATQGIMILVLGLMWPRLNLGSSAARTAFWTYVYSGFATLIPFILAAVWGAGNTVIPLAAGGARGSDFQEAAIGVVIYSAAPPFFVSMGLILWGLLRDRQAVNGNS
jgi:hydroxylaminobenzene mutase